MEFTTAPPTDKLYVSTDSKVAHRIIQLQRSKEYGTQDTYHAIKNMEFYTDDRMRKANELYISATTDLGFYTFDATRPQISRPPQISLPDAAWGGLQSMKKVAESPKMLTLMLLNKICDDSNCAAEMEQSLSM